MSWSVVYQTPRQELAPSGGFQQVVEVGFRTGLGATGHVTVPVSAYSVDEVKRRIDPYAAELDAVHQLTSE